MPTATVTVRELKNKDTGIDLSVTKVREVKAMLGSNYEYDITVVTNLQHFKTPKHKESDHVQFVISKKFSEFEELYSKLNSKFSGTVLPVLPKKVLMVSDTVARERRNGLNDFIRFLSMTPKICSSALLLEFLGVNPVKAGKFRTMEVSESSVAKGNADTAESSTGETDDTEEKEAVATTTPEDLFNEEEEEEDGDDLFGEVEEEQFDITNTAADDAKLFDDQDLGGGFAEGEGDDLFLVEALDDATKSASAPAQPEEEDTGDLFRIDDDLSKIMERSLKPNVEEEKPEVDDVSDSLVQLTSPEQIVTKPKPTIRTKPNIPKRPTSTDTIDSDISLAEAEKEINQSKTERPRPTPAPRPKPPIKQKPAAGQKPSISSKKPSVPNEKPSVPNEKPSVAKQKPAVVSKPPVTTRKPTIKDNEPEKVKPKEQIGQDDILKYIQENAAEESDDLDLFS